MLTFEPYNTSHTLTSTGYVSAPLEMVSERYIEMEWNFESNS